MLLRTKCPRSCSLTALFMNGARWHADEMQFGTKCNRMIFAVQQKRRANYFCYGTKNNFPLIEMQVVGPILFCSEETFVIAHTSWEMGRLNRSSDVNVRSK